MVAKCANPECGAPFLYLRDGKLFAIPRPGVSVRATRLEYFWLCATCAGKLKIDSFLEGEARPALWPETCVEIEQPL